MIAELSVEEVTRSAQYAEAIFKLVALLQSLFQQRSKVGFDMNTLCKLASFKDILSDEYGLQDISLPEVVIASHQASGRKRSSHSIEDVKVSEDSLDPVIFVDELFERHSYLSEPTVTGKAVLKRMKIEFNTLSTTLPPSIKYMVSTENFSLGKFMIEGPTDTPYDGGYFLFDLKLPNDYPNSSPSVNFLTTGGGSVRFNPNLYNCGKVCLSLLGTWAGEKWDPQVSNINQVLQSICYLIFVEEPYYNEPGYKRSEQSLVESKKYTMNIRRSTVQAAYLDHLTHPDPSFGAVVREMMVARWSTTKAIFENWASEDPTSRISSQIVEIEERLFPTSAKAAT
jgi:baculoviral IAP repeat-containing protein 6